MSSKKPILIFTQPQSSTLIGVIFIVTSSKDAYEDTNKTESLSNTLLVFSLSVSTLGFFSLSDADALFLGFGSR